MSKDPKEVKEGAKEISMESEVQVNSTCIEGILCATLPRWGPARIGKLSWQKVIWPLSHNPRDSNIDVGIVFNEIIHTEIDWKN